MDRGEDQNQSEPPSEAAPEGSEEGIADVVDGGTGGIARGEDDVPEEPAADGDYERRGIGRGFGVGFDEPSGIISVR